MQTIQSAFAFVFGHLVPKPLTLLAETETFGTPLYRNQKQAETVETAFSVGFGAKTETEFRSVSDCFLNNSITTQIETGIIAHFGIGQYFHN